MGRRRRQIPSPPAPYDPASLRAVADWLYRNRPQLADPGGQARVDRAHAVGRQLAVRLRNAAGREARKRNANLIASLVTGVGGNVKGRLTEQVTAVNEVSAHLWFAATNVFTGNERASSLAFALSVCVRMEAAKMAWEQPRARQNAPDFLESFRSMVMDSIALVETPHGRGSAFCIGSVDGHSVWLTAEHVIRETGRAEEVRLHTAGGVRRRSAVAGMTEKWSGEHDVAVLTAPIEAPALRLGAEPFLGTDVYALGHGGHREFPPSIIRGHVTELEERAGLGYIRSDAAAYPGNSGGPLMDIWGSVVGMIQQSAQGFVVALSVDSIPQEARRAQPPSPRAQPPPR